MASLEGQRTRLGSSREKKIGGSRVFYFESRLLCPSLHLSHLCIYAFLPLGDRGAVLRDHERLLGSLELTAG